MLVAIMQPTYLPWLGYFDLIDRVDHFVFLDDVKVSKQSWGVRNRIPVGQGELYLTISLGKSAAGSEQTFVEAVIDDSRKWRQKHLRTLEQTYSKAAHFPEVIADLRELLAGTYASLADLNIAIIRRFASRLRIETPTSRTSEFPTLKGVKDERLVEICRHLGADQYLSPQGSAVYIEKDRAGGAFPDAGIALFYHHFAHPEYGQIRQPFLSHMAMVDLLMLHGYEEAAKIIRSGRREMLPFQEFRKMRPELCGQ